MAANPYPTAVPFLPLHPSMSNMTKAVQECRGCDLYKHATQAVFGAGPATAKVIFVGEQPGDSEDLAGKPFVGPAGKLLDRAMQEAGIDRSEAYVTNAVKHFKFEQRGKRRLHKKPSVAQVKACRPWLEEEIKLIQPNLIVAMGATAAQSMMGASFGVMKERGRVHATPWGPQLIATVHPSSILRAPDEEARHRAYADFVADLKVVAKHLKSGTTARKHAPRRTELGLFDREAEAEIPGRQAEARARRTGKESAKPQATRRKRQLI